MGRALGRPEASCEICGCPNWFIDALGRDGRASTMPGGIRHWRRLHVDHIDWRGSRNDPDNVRLLCYRCNNLRRDGLLEDDEVWERQLWEWRAWFPDRRLKWLWRTPPSARARTALLTTSRFAAGEGLTHAGR